MQMTKSRIIYKIFFFVIYGLYFNPLWRAPLSDLTKKGIDWLFFLILVELREKYLKYFVLQNFKF